MAGSILEAAAFRVGLKRKEDYHLLNVLKCRPPENRDPTLEELENCRPYLIGQLEAVKPKMIVAFGRYAQAFVLGIPPTKVKVLEGAGNIIETNLIIDKTPVLALLSYHPSFVARNRNNDIAKAFNAHIKLAKNTLLKGKPRGIWKI
jgi:DNA polymerase